MLDKLRHAPRNLVAEVEIESTPSLPRSGLYVPFVCS
jgi:hypothetical protein